MYKVVVSPLAEQDLEEIWLYTFGEWSYRQADKYQDELSDAFVRLSRDINLGIVVDGIRPGYRKYKVNRHLIFYTISEPNKTISVIRILHEQMDLPRHLL